MKNAPIFLNFINFIFFTHFVWCICTFTTHTGHQRERWRVVCFTLFFFSSSIFSHWIHANGQRKFIEFWMYYYLTHPIHVRGPSVTYTAMRGVTEYVVKNAHINKMLEALRQFKIGMKLRWNNSSERARCWSTKCCNWVGGTWPPYTHKLYTIQQVDYIRTACIHVYIIIYFTFNCLEFWMISFQAWI